MQVIRDLSTLSPGGRSAITVGTFDGFHLGHRAILDALRDAAAPNGLTPTIVTFDPHPRKVVGKPGQPVVLLTTTREKLAIFEEAGIARCVVIPFSREFAALSSEAFIALLHERLHIGAMVIGYDHHFGKNREGGIEQLEALGARHGFGVAQVPPLQIDGEPVSSTRIRRCLEDGDAAGAARLLGRPYALTGTVVRGDQRGQTMGFPTANLEIDDADKLIPARGVYAVDVTVGAARYRGMMNIGVRPTFDFDRLTLEVHLFNFSASLYGEELTVFFRQYIRPVEYVLLVLL